MEFSTSDLSCLINLARQSKIHILNIENVRKQLSDNFAKELAEIIITDKFSLQSEFVKNILRFIYKLVGVIK